VASTIRLIAGLGNPGPHYSGTRHNAGFWFADGLAQRLGEGFKDESKFSGVVARSGELRLFKPDTFMNESGYAVARVAGFYKVEPDEILVAYDDLDLPPGTVRLKQDGGHGGHRGLRDVEAHLGSGAFTRVRIGIGHPGDRDAVTPWVLGRPGPDDERAIRDAIQRALDVVPMVLAGDFEKAATQLHTELKQGSEE
jgi:PTH1 family peptidyl-tRNA hydrolase